MIRFSSLVLCTALMTLPAFAAEGPQEQALAQGQAPATAATTNTVHHKKHKATASKTAAPGPDERRMDQGLQPDDKPDPQDAEIRKLNGGN